MFGNIQSLCYTAGPNSIGTVLILVLYLTVTALEVNCISKQILWKRDQTFGTRGGYREGKLDAVSR